MAHFDWLEFTCKNQHFDAVCEWFKSLGLGFTQLDHGGLMYDCSAIVAGNGRIYWMSDPEQAAARGVHVSLPGDALRALVGHGVDYIRLGSTIAVWLDHFTRVDIAFDDLDHLLDMNLIDQKLRDHECVTRARSQMEPSRDRWNPDGGVTIYVGSRSSDTFLRVYDKAAEQRKKALKDTKIQDVPDYWVRVEIQLRRERADAVFRAWLSDAIAGETYDLGGVVLGYLDFKEPSVTDTNRSRWQSSAWWVAFLEATSKIKLSGAKAVQTSIEKMLHWIEKQVAPTLFVLFEHNLHDFVDDRIKDAFYRLSPPKMALVAASAYHSSGV